MSECCRCGERGAVLTDARDYCHCCDPGTMLCEFCTELHHRDVEEEKREGIQ